MNIHKKLNIINHKKNIIRVMQVILSIFFFFSLNGCSKEEEIEKVSDMDFTVCDESRMPRELLELIDSKKDAPFKLTYGNKEYLYIVVGYGEQNRSNICVTVDDLFLSNNAIYIDTNLVSNGEENNQVVTYPYIVVKCEQYDLPVVFE